MSSRQSRRLNGKERLLAGISRMKVRRLVIAVIHLHDKKPLISGTREHQFAGRHVR